MEVDHLCKMANQIGQYYRSQPDRAEALKLTATHMRRFWDPRMRRSLFEHIDATGGEGLEPLALEAATTHREMLEGGLTSKA